MNIISGFWPILQHIFFILTRKNVETKQAFQQQETDGLEMKERTNGECVGGVRTVQYILQGSETHTERRHQYVWERYIMVPAVSSCQWSSLPGRGRYTE